MGGFTKSGKFRCMMKESRFKSCPVHTNFTIDHPEIKAFFVVEIEIVDDYTAGTLIATDLEHWCRATMVQGPDWLEDNRRNPQANFYPTYISIRPVDLRSYPDPKRLTKRDLVAIQTHLAKSEAFNG